MTKQEILEDVRLVFGKEIAKRFNEVTPRGCTSQISDEGIYIYAPNHRLLLVISPSKYVEAKQR